MIKETVKGYKVTTQYGAVDNLHPKGHTGIDLAVPEATPLYSVGRGVVEDVVNYGDTNIGQGVMLRLDSGEKVIYGHLSETKVEIGQQVEPGQLLALSGNTGRSTGPHLHLGAKESGDYTDPSQHLAAAVEAKNNPFIPDFIEKPVTNVNQSIDELNNKIDVFFYWMNPKHWITEGWDALGDLIAAASTGEYLIIATIIGLWMIALGAKWIKKWLFWGWIIYWTLRGFIFV